MRQTPDPKPEPPVCNCGHAKSEHFFTLPAADSPDPHYHGGENCGACARKGKAYMCGGYRPKEPAR